ncbi:MAG: Hpt domain-containing protein [Gemmatimonadetes bacterium]|nr:Hpt domain-containing protein [Gemmatimonadota bacterium]
MDTDLPDLDTSALDRLQQWGGTKLLSQMVRLFLDNSPARLDQIRIGLQEGLVGDAERGAHSLKSSAANVGATVVSRLAAEMEDLAGRGDMAGMEALRAGLEAAMERVRERLESVLEQMSETD